MEDRDEYMSALPADVVAQQQRAPFGPLVVVNPRLRAVGGAGARMYEGCLSVPGYNVGGLCAHVQGRRAGAGRQRAGGVLGRSTHGAARASLRCSSAALCSPAEGLLSSNPQSQALVERYLSVECEGLTVEGEPLQLQASGWQARILQHECDHLQARCRHRGRAVPASASTCCWRDGLAGGKHRRPCRLPIPCRAYCMSTVCSPAALPRAARAARRPACRTTSPSPAPAPAATQLTAPATCACEGRHSALERTRAWF